jgi:hypothetical protein
MGGEVRPVNKCLMTTVLGAAATISQEGLPALSSGPHHNQAHFFQEQKKNSSSFQGKKNTQLKRTLQAREKNTAHTQLKRTFQGQKNSAQAHFSSVRKKTQLKHTL